jgi:hypothetical protein
MSAQPQQCGRPSCKRWTLDVFCDFHRLNGKPGEKRVPRSGIDKKLSAILDVRCMELVEHVRAVPIEATVEAGLVVSGRPRASLEQLVECDVLSSDRFIDQAIYRFLRPYLEARTAAELSSLPVKVRPRDVGDCFAVTHRGFSVASVRATAVTMVGAKPFVANALSAGPHWQTLREALQYEIEREYQPTILEAPPPAYELSQVITVHPAGLSRHQLDEAAQASAHLREERTRLPAVDCVITLPDFSRLRLRPISSSSRLDFVYEAGTRRFHGCISLLGDDELVTVRLETKTPQHLIHRIWLSALLVSAAVLCAAVADDDVEHADAESNSPLWRGLSRPTEAHVMGHVRVLPPGRHPSTAKINQARRVGIRLGNRETLVSAHTRGAPVSAQIDIPLGHALDQLLRFGRSRLDS